MTRTEATMSDPTEPLEATRQLLQQAQTLISTAQEARDATEQERVQALDAIRALVSEGLGQLH
jgi:hypothetical protein